MLDMMMRKRHKMVEATLAAASLLIAHGCAAEVGVPEEHEHEHEHEHDEHVGADELLPAFAEPTRSGPYGVAIHEGGGTGGYSARVGCGTLPNNVIAVDTSVDTFLEATFWRFGASADATKIRVVVDGPVHWYHLSGYAAQGTTNELGRHWLAVSYPANVGGRQPSGNEPITVSVRVEFSGGSTTCGSTFEIWDRNAPNLPVGAARLQNLPVSRQHPTVDGPEDKLIVLTCYACADQAEAAAEFGSDLPDTPFLWEQGNRGNIRLESDLRAPYRATDTWVFVDTDGTFGGELPHNTTSRFVWRNRSEAVRTDTVGDAIQMDNSHNVRVPGGGVLNKPFAWEFYEHRHESPDRHDLAGVIGQSILVEQ
jgi:hypothetical protein